MDLLKYVSWLDDSWPLFPKGIYSAEIYEDNTDPPFGLPRESSSFFKIKSKHNILCFLTFLCLMSYFFKTVDTAT